LITDLIVKVRRIPLPEELTKNARHYLVRRLDDYAQRDGQLFSKVILVLENEFIAIFRRQVKSSLQSNAIVSHVSVASLQALLGRCIIRTENPVLHDSSTFSGEASASTVRILTCSAVALDMLLDLLTERGYNTVVDVQKTMMPIGVKDGKIISKK
jgi:hypothetical protein